MLIHHALVHQSRGTIYTRIAVTLVTAIPHHTTIVICIHRLQVTTHKHFNIIISNKYFLHVLGYSFATPVSQSSPLLTRQGCPPLYLPTYSATIQTHFNRNKE